MIVNMTNVVRGFIIAKPELADSDVDLIWAIWAWQLKNNKPSKKIESISSRELMKSWKEGLVSSPFNISRSRRKCQEHYPETRGESYAKKQRHQTVIKKDVKREADKAINGNSKRPASNSR